ncbi:ABC transporter substrate-binding protein [Enterococcus asini]|uniref:ABC transporter substrate-binding protein n=1 Tax=Enterococcus asini TaxID=57732 RepID=UPI002890DF7A|nr:ABC transporter substrate-binding protein [Enterococcus asini]MDT2757677.1 ABC transporter substrate-binding protein [Enterococcus asini]
MSEKSFQKKAWTALGISLASLLVLSACGSNSDKKASGGGSTPEDTVVLGTTDKIVTIDPAGSYDNGSFMVENNIYPFLYNFPYGSDVPEPDIAAEKGAFSEDGLSYTVKLKEGLKFANGNELTASDVVFSFERVVTIGENGKDLGNGPSSLLADMESVEATDDHTVVFHLKTPNNVTWEQVLATPAGPIVDEEVFSPDDLTPDADIVKEQAFAGPLKIDTYAINDSIAYSKNEDYQGIYGLAKSDKYQMKYYADASNMKLDIQNNKIDVAFRSLTATDVEDLEAKDNVKVHEGPGGELRYMTFNMAIQPFGTETEDADETKALAVRQAIAHSIDRQAIADNVYKGTYEPAYSFVPSSFTGFTPSLKEAYGDGNGAPDADKAKEVLEAAGIETPLEINIQYNGDHYGSSSPDEYAAIKQQLEETGLFTVNLAQTEWSTYSKDRVITDESNGSYPIYQLGWFPDFSDADNYLTPFFGKDNFVHNGYDSKEVQDQLAAEISDLDHDSRTKKIEGLQTTLAQDLPTIPLLEGKQIAVSGTDVKGVEDTLDASFKFRYGAISK